MIERITAALADRYRIEGEAGHGAFAVVYHAHDLKHQRAVALKVLRPEVSAALGAERFVMEIQVTARLQHPHILPLLDSGDADGLLYFVMPYVAGETLAARIARTGPLDLASTLAIAGEVADALDYAARQGIAHRDVKPENILLSDGHAFVADFGVARAMDVAGATRATRTGMFVGTPAYASPEQATSSELHAATDIYSLGCVVFEMLTGRIPFAGDAAAVLHQHLVAPPPALRTLRPDLPQRTERAVHRALAKDPARRFARASDFMVELAPSPALKTTARRTRVAVALGLVAVLATGFLTARSVWLQRWARNEALPQARALFEDDRPVAALRLLREVAAVVPEDPVLLALLDEWTVEAAITSVPAGARIEFRDVSSPSDEWVALGETPIRRARIPAALASYRVVLDGHATQFEVRDGAERAAFELSRVEAVPGDMVRVRGGLPQLASSALLPVDAFLLDRYEVTNRSFERFVRAGGYEREEYWRSALDAAPGRTWADARATFRDRTGRPGPATWSLGRYPEGTGEHPVAGVSWYEAMAYCAFVGRRLPTLHHWRRAADPYGTSALVQFGNFSVEGTRPVGNAGRMNSFGTYDLVGNVKEWVYNGADPGLRYVLGSSWGEALYQAYGYDSAPPETRDSKIGFRCSLHGDSTPAHTADVPPFDRPGAPKVEPVDDHIFAFYRRQFSYDLLPLDARIDSVREIPGLARVESVSYTAAYGHERVPALLLLPIGARPPYQTVLYFPGLNPFMSRRPIGSEADIFNLENFAFLLETGRAVLYPVYWGSFERFTRQITTTNEYRDEVIHVIKDAMRGIDYLESRADIDTTRIGFMGVSLGAQAGSVLLALEPRLRAGLLIAGGLPNSAITYVDEVRPEHYLPRVRTPTLMFNGRDDQLYGYETNQRVMFEALGTPAEDKLHCLGRGGHWPPEHDLMMRVSLDWLDRYLGPVDGSRPTQARVTC